MGPSLLLMKNLLFLFPVLIVFLLSSNSHAGKQAAKRTVDTPRMKQYWLVTLLKGTNRTHNKETAARIQKAHLSNMDRLAKEGFIVMAGPMGYDRDLRGILIIDAKDSASVATMVKTDSAVITGRLRFEIHPWWTQTGTYIFK